ncbi:hypothetical protein HPB52_022558 [Rhipicephalus sanguineus]|uniref:Uncharacterized protein n=1 Tax=Rhipicephalus sanguineus TaxID=34632 RepID=A0A9D4SQB0_RHISA|nr:hypothetical protein HPB52_022558 [Rhipicephalus sanguineus]
MTASTDAAPSSATTHASETSKKSGRSRSKTRSRSRSKTRTQSKSRSRSCSQSTSARIQEKRPTTPASQASLSPYKKALLGKPATSTATPDHQQPRASDNSNAMAAPREVSFEQGPAQLTPPPPHPPFHNTFRPSPPPNTNPDPFSEIARLRRDMKARHAEMHAQLDAPTESTNARIQAAIDNVRQESLALRKEIIAVIQASEERTHSLFADLVFRFDSVAPLFNPQAMQLEQHFIPTGPLPKYPDYPHEEESNEKLDADITVDEEHPNLSGEICRGVVHVSQDETSETVKSKLSAEPNVVTVRKLSNTPVAVITFAGTKWATEKILVRDRSLAAAQAAGSSYLLILLTAQQNTNASRAAFSAVVATRLELPVVPDGSRSQ